MDKDVCSLVFTGDIGFDKYMSGKWEDEELCSDEVLDFLRSGDHLIINVEGPLYKPEENKDEQITGAASLVHSMNPEAVSFFNKIGADVWNICNNHIMDAGAEGIKATLDEAKKNNVETLGAGLNIRDARKPVIFNQAGGIGLIGVGYQRACRKASEDTPGCFSWSDMDDIENSINEVKKSCKWCVVVAHGGEEFTALPSPYVRDRYHEYLNMGADIVVSHHPHVPMNYETVGEKIIFYSLGNFIFDTDYQRSQYNTEFGLFIKLMFTDNSFEFEPFGIKIDRFSEHVVKDKLPRIFTDVNEDEYEKLKALSAKMFIENTKRQLKYLKPDKFLNADEKTFIENFYEPLRSGRVPGEVLDFQIVYPLSLEADKELWKESNLPEVVEYIMEQIRSTDR